MSALRDALRSDEFAVTAELSLSPQQTISEIIAAAAKLQDTVDAVQIPDHRNARPHISPVAIAAHMLAAGLDPIVRMNCRDRNRIAVQSELLAARSFGISNLLLSRGTQLPDDHRPRTTGVYDLTAIDLVRTAAAIRDGEALTEKGNEDGTDFFIGTVATAFKPTDDWEPEKLLAKADAGAQFIQLQLCMDTDLLSSYAAHLVSSRLTWRFQVLANIAVLPSVDEARALRKSNPGSNIPAELVQRIAAAKDAEMEGVKIAAETIQALQEVPGIAGVNLQATADPELLLAAIEQSGVKLRGLG
jgi:methylenetetrahydrofolate reductase (NADPH)